MSTLIVAQAVIYYKIACVYGVDIYKVVEPKNREITVIKSGSMLSRTEFPIDSLTLIHTLSIPLSIKYSQIDTVLHIYT